jgi:hypothetical protein
MEESGRHRMAPRRFGFPGIGVVAAATLAAVALGCHSPAPAVRTAVMMRSDLVYDDVWESTVLAVSSLFPLQSVDREGRFLVSGYEYDDVGGSSYRWRTSAQIERLADHWAVRVMTEVEKLGSSGWVRVGFDDPTSMTILQRIDEQIFRLRGAPPQDDAIRFIDPSEKSASR